MRCEQDDSYYGTDQDDQFWPKVGGNLNTRFRGSEFNVMIFPPRRLTGVILTYGMSEARKPETFFEEMQHSGQLPTHRQLSDGLE